MKNFCLSKKNNLILKTVRAFARPVRLSAQKNPSVRARRARISAFRRKNSNCRKQFRKMNNFQTFKIYLLLKNQEYDIINFRGLKMGLMNLLKANYTQKVGATVGAEWKGKPVIRVLPEGPRKPSAHQSASLIAFGQLNKISGFIARTMYTNWADSKPHETLQNYIAHLCKPTIWDYRFNPISFYNIKGINSGFNLRTIALDATKKVLTMTFGSAGGILYPSGAPMYAAAFYGDGTPLGFLQFTVSMPRFTIQLSEAAASPVWVWVMTFEKKGRQYRLRWTDGSNGPVSASQTAPGVLSVQHPEISVKTVRVKKNKGVS
jgi:hypothetical protein